MSARIEHDFVDGFPATTLHSPDGRLSVTFHPTLNMLCSSLLHDGEELLFQRDGVAEYATSGRTCGMPLLHPWANRLSGDRYRVSGQLVALTDEVRPLRRDANGLPNHGLLGGETPWEVTTETADESCAGLAGVFHFRSSELLANFPFPHELRFRAQLGSGELRITTTLLPTSTRAVPLSFGYHPYFQLPGSPRENWLLTNPARKRLLVDDKAIPTGRSEAREASSEALGARSFDDAYSSIPPPHLFALEGGGRRIELELDAHYPFVQIYSPAGQPYCCIEPMTAPTNALVSGEPDLCFAEVGKSFEAGFLVRVSST